MSLLQFKVVYGAVHKGIPQRGGRRVFVKSGSGGGGLGKCGRPLNFGDFPQNSIYILRKTVKI